MQTGTVTYLEFEGGFYGIITPSGEKIYPLNLAKEYKVSGTKLQFSGYVKQDFFTTKQWGKPYELTAVTLVELGSGNIHPTH